MPRKGIKQTQVAQSAESRIDIAENHAALLRGHNGFANDNDRINEIFEMSTGQSLRKMKYNFFHEDKLFIATFRKQSSNV